MPKIVFEPLTPPLLKGGCEKSPSPYPLPLGERGKNNEIKKEVPSPLRDCVVIGKKSRHSGGSRNPVAVLLNNAIFLDARLRGHDKL
jgi:hypothetical protein